MHMCITGVTAHTILLSPQEGEAFLQTQGMAVTDDDVKTRAQKEKLEEITATAEEDGHDRPKIAREGTMAVTAKVVWS